MDIVNFFDSECAEGAMPEGIRERFFRKAGLPARYPKEYSDVYANTDLDTQRKWTDYRHGVFDSAWNWYANVQYMRDVLKITPTLSAEGSGAEKTWFELENS